MPWLPGSNRKRVGRLPDESTPPASGKPAPFYTEKRFPHDALWFCAPWPSTGLRLERAWRQFIQVARFGTGAAKSRASGVQGCRGLELFLAEALRFGRGASYSPHSRLC